jgi:ribose 5-phosphate isomerase B
MNQINRIIIGSDHAGFEIKTKIIEHLSYKKNIIIDVGTNSDKPTDYPTYAHKIGGIIYPKTVGILICENGNGMAMAANKWEYARAALCWDLETAKLARQYNDANILCLPARFISTIQALEIVDTFLATKFEGGRHTQRVNGIRI